MTNIVVVVKNGKIEQAYCRNKNVEVEVLDLAKSYKELL